MSAPKFEQLSEEDVKSLAMPAAKARAETAALMSELSAAIVGDGRGDTKTESKRSATAGREDDNDEAFKPTESETKRLLTEDRPPPPTRAGPKPQEPSIVRNSKVQPSPEAAIKSKESTLTVRKTALWIFITVCAVTLLAVAIMRQDDAGDDAGAAALTLDFKAMCDSKAPFTFATRDLRSNRSMVFYIEGDVEIFDVIHNGQVLYTENVDFGSDTVITFPEGRSLVAKRPCSVQKVDQERSWRDIVCKELSTQASDRMVLDDRQMVMTQPPSIMRPVPANFFDSKPQDCSGSPVPTEEDATQRADDTHVVAFRNMTPDHTLRPVMLTAVLELMSKEYGSEYVQSDALQATLEASFDHAQAAFMNASAWTRAPAVTNTSTDVDICCGLNQACREIMGGHQSALPALCAAYSTCVRRSPGERGCNDRQQSCECGLDFAAHLMQPGSSGCGDCRADAKACGCYAALWLQKWSLSRRTCSCKGMCVRAMSPYVCDTSKSCSGWWDIKCEITVHWCMRPEVYPCFRCNMIPEQSVPRPTAETPALCHV